jgi:hypothetical protein
MYAVQCNVWKCAGVRTTMSPGAKQAAAPAVRHAHTLKKSAPHSCLVNSNSSRSCSIQHRHPIIMSGKEAQGMATKGAEGDGRKPRGCRGPRSLYPIQAL